MYLYQGSPSAKFFSGVPRQAPGKPARPGAGSRSTVARPTPPRLLSPIQVSTYARARGHHVHQAASYSPGGSSRSGNPNYWKAITVGLPGHASSLRTQHGRATAVQRALNQGARGKDINMRAGEVRVQASGEGTLPPSPNQTFEDLKAYFALRAAGSAPEQSYDVVKQSVEQIERAGVRPMRVPSR